MTNNVQTDATERVVADLGGDPVKKEKHKMLATTKKAHIFCICVLAFMLVQWAIFFVYGNINSILLAFQFFDPATESQVFYGGKEIFTNFVNFIRFSDEKHYDIKRSGFVCSKWA